MLTRYLARAATRYRTMEEYINNGILIAAVFILICGYAVASWLF